MSLALRWALSLRLNEFASGTSSASHLISRSESTQTDLTPPNARVRAREGPSARRVERSTEPKVRGSNPLGRASETPCSSGLSAWMRAPRRSPVSVRGNGSGNLRSPRESGAWRATGHRRAAYAGSYPSRHPRPTRVRTGGPAFEGGGPRPRAPTGEGASRPLTRPRSLSRFGRFHPLRLARTATVRRRSGVRVIL